MRTKNYLEILLSILLVSLTHFFSKAQPGSGDKTINHSTHPVVAYYAALGEQSPLYTGSEYLDFAGTLHSGHPFYDTTEFISGTIHYDGMVFDSAMILYDIIKDKVLILHYNGVFRIDLPVKKIERFTLLGHTFIHILTDSTHQIEDGFYDQLYSGKITLLVKRKKLIREERTGNDIHNVVDEKNIFYIYKQSVYHTVKNLRSMLRVLPDKRVQIQQYLKKNGVKFRKQPEKALLMAVEFYDRSTN